MNIQFEKIAGISSSELKKQSSALKSFQQYLKHIVDKQTQDAPESSIILPYLAESQKKILAMVKKYGSSKLKCVVVIGIGGSNLGTKAIYDALFPSPLSKKGCELLFLETLSSTTLLSTATHLKSFKDPNTFLIVTISKSGGTTETMANLEGLLHSLQNTYKQPQILEKRCVVVSDYGSKFWVAAKEKNMDCLEIPKAVGGRYSVFSAVGLFPLALAGINIKALLEGAQLSIKDSLLNKASQSPALASACTTFFHLKNEKSIHNSFFFAPELESLGKWYRQLMGESIGKEKDQNGKIINAGITPIVSIGSTDLHSMAQLYFGGPNDKFTNIISVKKTENILLPKKLFFPKLVDNLAGKSFDELMQAVVGGVIATYKKLKYPFLTIELKQIDEKELGYFMQFRMIEMMYLANLMNVNAFDQPNVEQYKEETRKLLK